MDAIYKATGNNVKHIRTAKGISQLSLALAIGHKATRNDLNG
nr:hypothetical protein [uncultured Campylobacter sp.]